MQDPSYWREQAERAQRLARSQTNREVGGCCCAWHRITRIWRKT